MGIGKLTKQAGNSPFSPIDPIGIKHRPAEVPTLGWGGWDTRHIDRCTMHYDFREIPQNHILALLDPHQNGSHLMTPDPFPGVV